MSANPLLIAYLEVDYAPTPTEKYQSIIGITAPQVNDRCYECQVFIPDRVIPYRIFGDDSLQALGLGFKFLELRVNDMMVAGERFFFRDSDSEVPLEAYFSSGRAEQDAAANP